jgi:hypothetical protein
MTAPGWVLLSVCVIGLKMLGDGGGKWLGVKVLVLKGMLRGPGLDRGGSKGVALALEVSLVVHMTVSRIGHDAF